MTEATVRELFGRLVEDGPPAGVQVPVQDVLRRNGRTLRRRRLRQGGAAGALAALAAGLALLLPNLSGAGAVPGAGPLAPAEGSSTLAAPTTPEQARPEQSAPEQGKQAEANNRRRAEAMLRRLTGAVPAGYTLPVSANTRKSQNVEEYVLRHVSWRGAASPKFGGALSEALLEVQLDGRAAVLILRAVESRSPTPAPAGLCGTPLSPEEQGCRVVNARDGSPVRIAWWKTAAGPTRQATRWYGGEFVQLEQSSRPRTGVYGLGRPVFTDQQLADLAADPEFAP